MQRGKATPQVVSCSASTGIHATLASDFPSNQLGVQNTFNIPTNLSSSTHPRQFTGSSMSLRSSKHHHNHHIFDICSRCYIETRTAYGSRAFSVAVPNIWNKLRADVLDANSLPVFRRRLKTLSLYCRLNSLSEAAAFVMSRPHYWRQNVAGTGDKLSPGDIFLASVDEP